MTSYARLERLFETLAQPSGSAGVPGGATAARRLAAYIEREPATALHATAREIDALLGAGLCEYQLAHIVLYELGCAYDPAHDGLEVSDWLRTLRDRLRAAADRQPYADAL